MSAPTPPTLDYFHERIHKEYRATEDDYTFEVGTNLGEDEPYMRGTRTRQYFRRNVDTGGIVITSFDLNREVYHYPLDIKNEKYKPYEIERNHPDRVEEFGKYKFPSGKGLGTFPFWPVSVVESYEDKATTQDTFIITEGWLKAWYAGRFGFPIAGLSSITHYRDKNTRSIHKDIPLYIQTKKVKHAIILWDADCLSISQSDLKEGKDLRSRPFGFLTAALALRELLLDYVPNIWFAHVKPGMSLRDELDIPMPSPKGLDDLLVALPGREADILKDLTSLSTPPTFFERMDITRDTGRLFPHFHLKDPSLFYQHHADIIKDQEFIFNGTHYTWDKEKTELIIKIPVAAKSYALVGDDFFKWVNIPDKYGNDNRHMRSRQIGTINRLHGKNFPAYIPVYEAFCNVPSHTEYRPVVNNCLNKYCEFLHEPAEGNCEKTLSFLEHIFGSQLDMALDYVQLMYQQPALPPNIFMPILCLVSKENNTGKSTFGKLLKAIFTDNCKFIGNQDLQENFNAHYISALVICVEEAFVDKKTTVERLKSMATSSRQTLKDKHISNNEIDFFARIIIDTNNEDNFIYADKHDTRYWVVKVPKLKTLNVNILSEMILEIPAFLNYLNNRVLSRPKPVTRFWFSFEDIQTEAFRRLVDQSRRYIDKDFELVMRDLFFEFPDQSKISLSITAMAALLKTKGQQYKNREIIDHLRRELGIEIKQQHSLNVLELTPDGPNNYQLSLSLSPKNARAHTFDRRDWLTDDEVALMTAHPTEAKPLTLADIQPLLAATQKSQSVASLFDDEYQVWVDRAERWVKVTASTGFATALSKDKWEGIEVVKFVN